jgi:eukaryotic-like serine/threonine-protein kinase
MTKTELDNLIGQTVGDWKLVKFINAGKSAAVFRGVNGSQTAAVKIFDPALIEEFGRASQLKRILRELDLRGHAHPNLIQIFDGGECKATGHLYIVMEFIEAPDLASVISQVPRDYIRRIIAQVADAARYLLEDRDIVHRDIKPDNIAISTDFSKAILLDLGVIRPLDVSSLAESSDGQRQGFLGTMRYAPPEYIFRQEQTNREGFRAITFYQLGAVLYDLITRERIFKAFELPKARLVKAVEEEIPKIQQTDVPVDLIWLAKNCLLKKPEHRLLSVKWEDFQEPANMEPSSAARNRVMRRFASSLEVEMTSEEQGGKTALDLERGVDRVQRRITPILKNICSSEKMFPRSLTRELPDLVDNPSANVLVVFEASTKLCISRPLALFATAQLIDMDPEVIEITIRAVIPYEDSPLDLKELKTSNGFSVFKGVFDDGIIRSRLEDAVFTVIDFAQASTEADTKVYFKLPHNDA